jgi:hypothetical protein
MCDPITISSVGVALYSGMQKYQQGKFEEGVAKYNARQTENEAVRTRNAGVEAENIHREKVAQLISQQRAAAGASNVDLDSGTPLRLVTDTESMGNADALRIRGNYEDKAQAMDDQAKLTLAEGRNAKKQGKIGLATSILTAGVGAYAGYADWMKAGQSVNVRWYQDDGSLSASQRLR